MRIPPILLTLDIGPETAPSHRRQRDTLTGMTDTFSQLQTSLEQQRAGLREQYGPNAERVLAAAAVAEVVGKVATWVSLARRSEAEVRGPKWLWRAATGVNFFGPVAYWLFGRKRRGK